MSLMRLLKALTNTFFKNSRVELRHLNVPIKVIRLLKQQVDTLEPNELFFIGEVEKRNQEERSPTMDPNHLN